ncbi:unnamed protein product [Phytophthora lilii]|uniref:Unnamed protein product n=1 Tax=Phytophthora lilii TaxID=2077276 RepID=A0A9W6WNL1_9STRA|nr:unnamed protein product [Phytophthora lilii]
MLTEPEKTESEPQKELTNLSARRLFVTPVGDIRLNWYASPANTQDRKLQHRHPQSMNGPPLREAAVRSCTGSLGKNSQTYFDSSTALQDIRIPSTSSSPSATCNGPINCGSLGSLRHPTRKSTSSKKPSLK